MKTFFPKAPPSNEAASAVERSWFGHMLYLAGGPEAEDAATREKESRQQEPADFENEKKQYCFMWIIFTLVIGGYCMYNRYLQVPENDSFSPGPSF